MKGLVPMTRINLVDDEFDDRLQARIDELKARVKKGALSEEYALAAIQRVIEGSCPRIPPFSPYELRVAELDLSRSLAKRLTHTEIRGTFLLRADDLCRLTEAELEQAGFGKHPREAIKKALRQYGLALYTGGPEQRVWLTSRPQAVAPPQF